MTATAPAGPATTLEALRDATRADHERLELRVGALVPPAGADAGRWRALLEGLLGVVEPLEARLAASPLRAALPDLGERLRAPLLRADLRALGADPTAAARCPDVPDAGGLPAAFGVAYVLEGSVLGGAGIAKAVRRDAPALGDALRFFSAGGTPVGRRWRAFLTALDRWDAAPADRRAAGLAAQGTFLALERWLDARGVLA